MFEQVFIAQLNPIVGDITGNVAQLEAAYAQAKATGAAFMVAQELAITGYPPEDLLLQTAFIDASMQAANTLAAQTKDGPPMLVGGIWRMGDGLRNAALLLEGGVVKAVQPKRHLPNEGVFDEQRYFVAGDVSTVMEISGTRYGVLVCEDIWNDQPAADCAALGAEALIVLNASPYARGKLAKRHDLAAARAQAHNLPVLYVNMVGGQDDLVFDGHSFVMTAQGQIKAMAPGFAPYQGLMKEIPTPDATQDQAEIWDALRLGLRDYVQKNGFKQVVLGISGGIDSALTATLAVDALGSEAVLGVLLPSHYTSDASNADAHELAKHLGIRTTTLPIAAGFNALTETLAPVLDATTPGWREAVTVGGIFKQGCVVSCSWRCPMPQGLCYFPPAINLKSQ